MEKLLSKLPQLFPLRGKCIIAFTAEQVATYKMKIFGDDIKIQIDTSWHPDEHSIEEAIIVTTNPTQTKLQPGDGVLVDYNIFTAGRHDHGGDNNSRFLYKNEDYFLYWCYDDLHDLNSSEILATIDDEGKVKGYGDVVIVYTHEEHEVLIDIVTSMADIHQFPGSEWALVYNSPVPQIEENDLILCEKGLSPKIRFRGIEMQYINLPFILGKASLDSPFKIALF